MEYINALIKFIQENFGLVFVGVITLIQIAPIRIDPWSKLFQWIGNCINGDIKTDVERIEEKQEIFSMRLENMENKNKQRELNKLRDRLLQSYRYYTSDNNPQKAWTAMEADTFWLMFHDYEDMGGDGYMHTNVEPDMRCLEVIQMNDPERLSVLMSSRR